MWEHREEDGMSVVYSRGLCLFITPCFVCSVEVAKHVYICRLDTFSFPQKYKHPLNQSQEKTSVPGEPIKRIDGLHFWFSVPFSPLKWLGKGAFLFPRVLFSKWFKMLKYSDISAKKYLIFFFSWAQRLIQSDSASIHQQSHGTIYYINLAIQHYRSFTNSPDFVARYSDEMES